MLFLWLSLWRELSDCRDVCVTECRTVVGEILGICRSLIGIGMSYLQKRARLLVGDREVEVL
jgi:hypothetical protein